MNNFIKNNLIVRKVRQILPKVQGNPIDTLYDHLLGKHHKPHHRLIMGTFIITVGIILSDSSVIITFLGVNYIMKIGSELLYCIGGTPWLNEFMKKREPKN